MGKSLFSLQIARHVARSAGPVLFASLEMSDAETAQRHLAAESGVDPDRIHLGHVTGTDWPALLQAAAGTVGMPLHLIDDGDLSLSKLRAQARQLAVRNDGLRLIVVDYLQLMRVERPTGNRVEDVSEFSRGLKRLARELRCPVLAVSQLSRAVEHRPDKRPLLSDLRESGQIEADADCVLMLYREDYYDPDSDRQGEMDIIVRKNRHGGLGQITGELDQHPRLGVGDRQHPIVEMGRPDALTVSGGVVNGDRGAAR
jgi:replicative DNA helicase